MTANFGVKGFVELDIIEEATGQVLEHWKGDNHIIPFGFTYLLLSIGAPGSQNPSEQVDFKINSIIFGTNGNPNNLSGEPGYNTPASVVDGFTKLLDPISSGNVSRVQITGSSWTNKVMQHKFSLLAGEYNGNTIRELALLAEDFGATNSGDVLVARITRAPIQKTSAIRLEGTWTWEYTLSANP